MKKLTALTCLALASQAAISFAGPPEPKEVVPTPAPPPESFFRGNEFDVGIFATYVTGTGGGGSRSRTFADGDTVTITSSGSPDGWGGGMDFTYFLPWKWVGFRFQGAGVELSSSNLTGTITGPNDSFRFSRSNSFSAGAGIITGDLVLRLPLDDFWPGVHLAPYAFGGGGGVFTGAGGNTINTRFPELNEEFNRTSSNVNNDRGLGHVGGGLEYRFTPHIGIFGEAGYDWVAGGQHNFNSSVKNFIQANFGFRFAF
ncbi:MAG: hypothetical protein JOZ31_11100 [Verrucomicrobia bacterium]|nr:hypothetical protein [Verrucomicrobiota bacterium]MBV8484713.1 hypothetical protein [Verrucomicrobiota bacterium]